MNNKSDDYPDQDELRSAQTPIRCEPLLGRIDPVLREFGSESMLAGRISVSNGLDGLTLNPPCFTRLTSDAVLSPMSQQLFLSELSSFGIAWLGNLVEPIGRTVSERKENESKSFPRISPLRMDEPIDAAAFQNAAAIELQLFGLPFQTLANSRRARWTPCLPIDISKFEQLGKRVEVLRVLSGGRCPIGAAVCPGAVYEDSRYLIDSGFDFITLLIDIQYEMSHLCRLRLAPLDSTLEQSIKAVQDSGAKTKILVSANLCDGLQMFRCLQMGVTAISIDAFIAKSRPTDSVPVKDRFGSVLSAYAPAASFAWIKPAMAQLIEDLRDCAIYAGW